MWLQRIRFYDFRNLANQQMHLKAGVNFFVGENGQGKTNFLEAVYLMAHNSSFRPVDSASLLKQSDGLKTQRAKLEGDFISEKGKTKVEIIIEQGRRRAFLNSKPIGSGQLATQIPCILFSPESLSAIKEGPDARRKIVDELAIMHSPKNARLLAEQRRALKSRNRLLKNMAEKQNKNSDFEMMLKSLDTLYFLLSTEATFARLQALKDIQPDLVNAIDFVSELETVDISVEYLISEQNASSWSEQQIFDALQKRADELALAERALGASLVGPHKHDIRFLYNGKDSRFYCSQGQQRALILSFKIAQIVYYHRTQGNYPILLLDDVMSELDAKKRMGLMRFLSGISAQVLLTSTDLTWPESTPDALAGTKHFILAVANGVIEEHNMASEWAAESKQGE